METSWKRFQRVVILYLYTEKMTSKSSAIKDQVDAQCLRPLESEAFKLFISSGDSILMALIQFTKNHTDHSTDKGYQFEFFCDRCGNGFMSEFKASAVGMAASALHAAGSFFGGILGQAASSSYEIERAVQ